MNEDFFYVDSSCMVLEVFATRRTRGRVMELMNSFHKLRCIYIYPILAGSDICIPSAYSSIEQVFGPRSSIGGAETWSASVA